MRRCTRCKGFGSYMPAHGTTKADIRPCKLCKGSGYLPADYVIKEDKRVRKARYINKLDGIILLKDIEEV